MLFFAARFCRNYNIVFTCIVVSVFKVLKSIPRSFGNPTSKIMLGVGLQVHGEGLGTSQSHWARSCQQTWAQLHYTATQNTVHWYSTTLILMFFRDIRRWEVKAVTVTVTNNGTSLLSNCRQTVVNHSKRMTFRQPLTILSTNWQSSHQAPCSFPIWFGRRTMTLCTAV